MKKICEQELIAMVLGSLAAYNIVADHRLPLWRGGFIKTFLRCREEAKNTIQREREKRSFYERMAAL